MDKDTAKTRVRQNVDLVAALIVIVIGLAFALQLGRINNTLDLAFPAFVLGVLAVLTVILLIKSFVKPDRKTMFTEARLRQTILSIILGAAWVALIPVIGFFVCAYLFLMCYSLMLDDKLRQIKEGNEIWRRVVVTFVVNAVLLLFIYFVFVQFLGIRFPGGAFL